MLYGIVILVTDFNAEQLGLLDMCITDAQSIGMPIYRGARVFPNNPFSDWVNPAHWMTCASNFQLLADRRLAGDPRIGIDAENYLSDIEPTIRSLTDPAHGYTVAQFRAAIRPFLDKMVEVGAIACVYQQIRATTVDDLNQFIVALLGALGASGVQVWWEDTFGREQAAKVSWQRLKRPPGS